MTLQNIIRDRTDDGVDIIDFLVNVMRNELIGLKPCHRLDAAKLLVKYERDEALNFTLDYTPEPSRSRSDSRSSEGTYFDQKLAKVIQQSNRWGLQSSLRADLPKPRSRTFAGGGHAVVWSEGCDTTRNHDVDEELGLWSVRRLCLRLITHWQEASVSNLVGPGLPAFARC